MPPVERKKKGYQHARQLLSLVAIHYPELYNATLPEILARLSPARHSSDFRCVAWFGQDYVFSPSQAVVVRELWKAWVHGTPKVGAACLLEAADMESDRISELFRKHEAWGTMIRNEQGVYWLQPPE